ncbi:MAG: hypothetical protein ACE5G2_10445, partial [Candidatus Krumholzibacteriia bacterium]
MDGTPQARRRGSWHRRACIRARLRTAGAAAAACVLLGAGCSPGPAKVRPWRVHRPPWIRVGLAVRAPDLILR